MRIAIISNTSWYIYNFRSNLIQALKAANHEVFAIGPQDGYEDKIKHLGITHLPLKISGDGINPLKESATLFTLIQILRRNNIEVVLSYTPKGNIYSSIAALVSGSTVIPNVSGLGSTFIKRSHLTHIITHLYRFSFKYCPFVIFQNNDDLNLFLKMHLVKHQQAVLVPGSGVDLKRFTPSRRKRHSDKINFLVIARILRDKGILEYIDAAHQLKKKYQNVNFQLLGQIDAQNPTAIPLVDINRWQAEDIIEYIGVSDDVRPHIENADCVVLASYREGTPKSLLEAAAMGKPIVTTDATGCRNTIDDGVTGFLCKTQDAQDLAQKMERVLLMSHPERELMGLKGRQKMESQFDEESVINKYSSLIKEL